MDSYRLGDGKARIILSGGIKASDMSYATECIGRYWDCEYILFGKTIIKSRQRVSYFGERDEVANFGICRITDCRLR